MHAKDRALHSVALVVRVVRAVRGVVVEVGVVGEERGRERRRRGRPADNLVIVYL